MIALISFSVLLHLKLRSTNDGIIVRTYYKGDLTTGRAIDSYVQLLTLDSNIYLVEKIEGKMYQLNGEKLVEILNTHTKIEYATVHDNKIHVLIKKPPYYVIESYQVSPLPLKVDSIEVLISPLSVYENQSDSFNDKLFKNTILYNNVVKIDTTLNPNETIQKLSEVIAKEERNESLTNEEYSFSEKIILSEGINVITNSSCYQINYADSETIYDFSDCYESKKRTFRIPYIKLEDNSKVPASSALYADDNSILVVYDNLAFANGIALFDNNGKLYWKKEFTEDVIAATKNNNIIAVAVVANNNKLIVYQYPLKED